MKDYGYHPTLGIAVRSDGMILIRGGSRGRKPHWTFGWKDRKGYLHVQINGKMYLVHRLVAETFIGPIPNGYEIDHLNRLPQDNRCENLRIVTRSQNNRNRKCCDRIDARGGTHKYEDAKQYRKEQGIRRCKTHKYVLFMDGKKHWVPNELAHTIMSIPVKERKYA